MYRFRCTDVKKDQIYRERYEINTTVSSFNFLNACLSIILIVIKNQILIKI